MGDAGELADAAIAGDRRALARLLTAVENRTPVAEAAMRQLYPRAGQAHIVTVTGQLGLNTQDPTRIGATQLPQVGGNTTGHSGALAIQVASRFGALVNQFRLGGSLTHSASTPFLAMPVGRVLTTSALDSGRIATTTLGFGGNAGHQRLLMANLVSSLIAAEGIVTTEAKAKALRPIAEKVITKARKGGLHNHRQVLAYLGDQEIAAKLMDEIGPRFADRPGGYTRILKLGPRPGDNAPMARIELV